jgi:hypothetical protein
METVGRHHDPFTAMAHFARPTPGNAYAQPLTDWPAAVMARALGAVAGYNFLVLLTFPLAAAATYLLARHLAIPHAFAVVAAMAFAFAPFHLAQAAYHPHIAQTQWIPLFLLALWRGLDRGTPGAMAWLALALAGVVLSNFYGGLVVAAVTPAAAFAYWATRTRHRPRGSRHLVVVAITLGIIVTGAVLYLLATGHPAALRPAAFAYPDEELFRYSARWWSYVMPPLAHPVLGDVAADLWSRAGVREGRLEQQVALGWGILGLACAAVMAWFRRADPTLSLAFVPVLVITAAVAFLCSLAPTWTLGTATVPRPSGLIHEMLPMFRAYARFGVLVQLMAVLLAAIGAQRLWRSGHGAARLGCLTLLALAAAEYAAWPPSLSRDVLPTTAHRWVVNQPGRVRALDCAALTVESGSVGWLTSDRIGMRSGAFDDCTAPDLAGRLSAERYTHLLIQQGTVEARWIRAAGTPPGLVRVARFRDGEVFAVMGPAPPVHTARVIGFYPREYEGERTWRWMGASAAWEVLNSDPRPLTVTAEVELSAFARSRRLSVSLDGRQLEIMDVAPPRTTARLAAFVLTPGRHTLAFEPLEPPTRASSRDERPLSVAFGPWRWIVAESPQ